MKDQKQGKANGPARSPPLTVAKSMVAPGWSTATVFWS
jgi:hypothetical protein